MSSDKNTVEVYRRYMEWNFHVAIMRRPIDPYVRETFDANNIKTDKTLAEFKNALHAMFSGWGWYGQNCCVSQQTLAEHMGTDRKRVNKWIAAAEAAAIIKRIGYSEKYGTNIYEIAPFWTAAGEAAVTLPSEQPAPEPAEPAEDQAEIAAEARRQAAREAILSARSHEDLDLARRTFYYVDLPPPDEIEAKRRELDEALVRQP